MLTKLTLLVCLILAFVPLVVHGMTLKEAALSRGPLGAALKKVSLREAAINLALATNTHFIGGPNSWVKPIMTVGGEEVSQCF